MCKGRGNAEMQLGAHTTIAASLLMTVLITFIYASIQSAGISLSVTKSIMISNLTTESAFSMYYTDLFNEYDLLFSKYDKNEWLTRMNTVAEKNTAGSSLFGRTRLENIRINKVVRPTDSGGTGFEKSVLKYMRYGIVAQLGEELIYGERIKKQAEESRKITEEILQCSQIISDVDEQTLIFVSDVEGILVDDNGFMSNNNLPVTNEAISFSKKLINGNTMQSRGINDLRVFAVLDKNHVDINSEIGIMLRETTVIRELSDDVDEIIMLPQGNNILMDTLKDLRQQVVRLNENVTETIAINNNVFALSDKIKQDKAEVRNQSNVIKENVVEKKDVLGEDLANAYISECSEIEKTLTDNKNICDVELITERLQANNEILINVNNCLNAVLSELNTGTLSKIIDKLSEMLILLKDYRIDDCVIDYSNIQFGTRGIGISAIKNLYHLLTQGNLALILGDENNLSDYTLQYEDLASAFINDINSENNDSVLDNHIYNQYLWEKFQCYTDVNDSGKDNRSNIRPEYEIEYILKGNKTDKENLQDVVADITLIRQGVNFVHILTDTSKKEECHALALSLLGFTGNAAIIKAGQFLIMTVWAYAESICDMRSLMKDEKIPIIKNKDNWNLSLSAMMSMEFTDTKENSDGIDYEQYLQLLLLCENRVKKNFYTMDLCELRMIELGNGDFRFRKCAYGIEAEFVFDIKCGINSNNIMLSNNRFYTNKTAYSY